MQTVSDTLLSALAASFFGAVAYNAPATLYVGFGYDATDPLADGTEVDPSGTNYARTAVTNDQSVGFNAPTGSGGTLAATNKNDIQSPKSTAAWHTAGHPINVVWLFSASTGGAPLAGALLDPTRTVDDANIRITIEAGQASFTLASA